MGSQASSETQVKTSVRNLVEFVLRSGDIDNRHKGGEKLAMQEGSRLHRKIQRRMGGDYQAEVSFKEEIPRDEVIIVLEGRADGIFTEGDTVYIDEIKCMYMDINRLDAPILVHRAQAMCYAYLYAVQNHKFGMGIQMTYCNIETEEIRRFKEVISFDELEQWFLEVIREYAKWAKYRYHHRQARKATIMGLEFPFPYRKGQRNLAVAVYKSITGGKNLFIQAPTGIGKTMSTVFPAVKAIGEGSGDQLFYLTAKTITRTVAEEAFSILREKGLRFSTVTITAKEKLCPQEAMECNPDACPYARGYYDRVNEAVFDILHQEEAITREVLLAFAMERKLCPFEFGLDITLWADGIICDYNYVFDPNVSLRRFFADGVQGDYIFLVDEAHNLVERAREMYSAALYKEDVLSVRRQVKAVDSRLAKALEACNKMLLELKRECDTYKVLDSVSHLAMGMQSVYTRLEEFMEERPDKVTDEILDFFFCVRDFLSVNELTDENYCIYTEHTGDNRFMVKLFCMNPAANLKTCLSKAKASVFFSATLLPVNYYKKLLSGNVEDYAVYAVSPFAEENRFLAAGNDVSSRFTRRTKEEFGKILDYIRAVAAGRTGNYMVFFPSYHYMNQVFDLCGEEPFDIIKQSGIMSEAKREEFLAEFETKRERSLVAFCVMGGIFSEGIDLKGESLIGAILVGTGLPQVCTRQELLRQYFEEKEGQGFRYAYVYPGMNKVMQAAGRVIRTAEDKGVIILLDDRFLRQEYVDLFPAEWYGCQVTNRRTIGEQVKNFWAGNEPF